MVFVLFALLGGVLSGCGGKEVFTRASNVDTFFQKGGSSHTPIEIVWVVDNSGSMYDEQQLLAANFTNFIESFLTLEVDFKMAIVTTDGHTNRDSEEKLNLAEAKKDKKGFIDYFKKKIKVGISGSGHERGLEMSKKFLQRHSNWLTPTAHLIIIYVSDEDDSSAESDHGVYVRYFRSLKENHPSRVKVFSITDTRNNNRYMAVTKELDGVSKGIREPFDKILEGFGTEIVSLSSLFALRIGAKLDTIKVFVNDKLSPPTHWNYMKKEHAIRFKESYIPPENSHIKIYYKVSN